MASTHQERIRSVWQVRSAAGEPFAVVRVRNLQAVVQGPHDAWGREGKPQPFLVSAELSFTSPFDASVAGDNVTSGDTVHYGSLSKTILASLEAYSPQRATPAAGGRPGGQSLRDVLETIWSTLTGLRVDGDRDERVDKAFLDLSKVRFMSITVTLPKASLLGEGVSLTASSVFDTLDISSPVAMFSISLRLLRLRVPTLIGVNSNEREAKQFVITDVELDKFDYSPDAYTILESLVVKVGEQNLSIYLSYVVILIVNLGYGGVLI